jgi:hypothetical protein
LRSASLDVEAFAMHFFRRPIPPICLP